MIIAMALCGLAVAADPPDLIPLPVVFPEENDAHFEDFWAHVPIGMPQRIQDGWLKPQALPLVPRGVRNLALHAPVIASDREPEIGELAMITDGDKGAGSSSFVELGPGTQWVQIDLREARELWAVVLWHYHDQTRFYKGVVVQVADDAAFTTHVRTLFNNDRDNTVGQGVGGDWPYPDANRGRVFPAAGATARFVRCWSRGSNRNDLNHYVEVEVWGR